VSKVTASVRSAVSPDLHCFMCVCKVGTRPSVHQTHIPPTFLTPGLDGGNLKCLQ